MTRKTVKLLTGAVNIKVHEVNDIETTLTFNADPWGPHKMCIYIVPGQWEIESINKHLVTLVNHDTVIPDLKPFKISENG